MQVNKPKVARPSVAKAINAEKLIKRLQEHALANQFTNPQALMNQTQVHAALGLLKKVAPDLAAQQIEGEIDHTLTIKWKSK